MSAHLAGLVSAGHVEHGHAAVVLQDAAKSASALREALLVVQGDPDAVPLTAALLAQAVDLTENPLPPSQVRDRPDASPFTARPIE